VSTTKSQKTLYPDIHTTNKNIKFGHRYSQIFTDIWLFVIFNILVIRVHPCPQKRKFLYFELSSLRSKLASGS